MRDIRRDNSVVSKMAPTYERTLRALTSLQGSLNCHTCNTGSKELFTLSGCEHKLCRRCSEMVSGNSCPVCSIPIQVKDVQVDTQLSNLVMLCLELRQILEAGSTHCSPSKSQSDVTEPQLLLCTPQTHVKSNSSTDLSSLNPRDDSHDQNKDELRCVGDDRTRDELQSVYDFMSSPDTSRRHKVGKNEVITKKTGLVTRQRRVKKTQIKADQGSVDDRTSSSRHRFTLGPVEQLSIRHHKNKTDNRRRHSLPLHSLPKEKRSSVFCGSPLCTKRRAASKCVVSSPSGSQTKRNTKGETPLHVAAIKGQIDIIKILLKDGANPNVQDNAGWTPLHECCNHGFTRIAELLLDHGAMINLPGMDNDTPLHDAVVNHRIECVSMLVSRGASVIARNVHGLTPVDCALSDAMKEALKTPVLIRKEEIATEKMEEVDVCQVLYFTATSMSREQKIHLHKCASKLNAKVVEDLTPEVSHVITGCNQDGMCPRTLKYLHAVLAGKWIVSTEWLDICVEYGKPMLEEAFEVGGSSTHPGSKAAYKGRINKKQQLPGLFDGCQFYFHGPFVYPTPEKSELIELVKCGGGQILTREPKLQNLDDYDVTVPYHAAPDGRLADCGLFIVFDNNSVLPPNKLSRLCAVSASWIMNSIAVFSLLDPDSKN